MPLMSSRVVMKVMD
jgi:hypothetical protein